MLCGSRAKVIVLRTESDRVAYGIRSDGVRVTMTKREQKLLKTFVYA